MFVVKDQKIETGTTEVLVKDVLVVNVYNDYWVGVYKGVNDWFNVKRSTLNGHNWQIGKIVNSF